MLKIEKSQNPLLTVAEVELHYITKVKATDRVKIYSSRQAYEILLKIFDPAKIEHKEFFYAMFLNRANYLLGCIKISEGGLIGTVVDVRNILQAAILTNACSFIVSHNHPSGNLQPSEADKSLTRRISDAGNVIDISLRDHIILTPNAYYSFADEGLL